MISCRLCGYQALRDTCALLQCPVCGEAYAGDDGQNGVVAESGLTQGGSASCGTTQQQSQFGAPVLAQCNNSQVFPLCYLNQELQSLLHLVPEQQRRKKRAQDAVRAAGALTPARADDDHGKPDAVYIRPRVDPTMRVLKVKIVDALKTLTFDGIVLRQLNISSTKQPVLRQVHVSHTDNAWDANFFKSTPSYCSCKALLIIHVSNYSIYTIAESSIKYKYQIVWYYS